MSTQCNPKRFQFQGLGGRTVVGGFDGGEITSDAGGLLLREVEKRTGVIHQFAGCFRDGRNAKLIEHSVQELVGQRVYALALGYEDLNDHDDLRRDHLLATLVEKEDPTGQNRRQEQDRGKPLAGKSTLNRLELHAGGESQDRYKKIGVDEAAVERFLVKVFLDRYETPPARITVDLDATDDPLHGHQEGRFFHGFYNCYCYLPLYMFCGGFPLCAQLRVSNIDVSEGTVEVLERMVGQIRERWPQVEILIRGDSGFAREKIMAWCEANGVDYLLGLAKNKRLLREIEKEQERARAGFERRGQPTRIFAEFSYRTRKSWSRSRRVVAKAEHLAKGANPRFIVTSLSREQIKARPLYERVYCARGDMENRIKEQQLDLFADRTSSSKMRANQLRLWLSTVAGLLQTLLLHLFRELGLKGTEMAKAQCGTIRLKLLKIGAQVKVSVRRIVVAFAVGYPYQRIFAQVYENLLRVSPILRRAGPVLS